VGRTFPAAFSLNYKVWRASPNGFTVIASSANTSFRNRIELATYLPVTHLPVKILPGKRDRKM